MRNDVLLGDLVVREPVPNDLVIRERGAIHTVRLRMPPLGQLVWQPFELQHVLSMLSVLVLGGTVEREPLHLERPHRTGAQPGADAA